MTESLMFAEHDAHSSRHYKEEWDDAVKLLNEKDAESARLRAALQTFVTRAKSWHNFHHGSETIQCDGLCEAIAPGEAALDSQAAGTFKNNLEIERGVSQRLAAKLAWYQREYGDQPHDGIKGMSDG